MLVELAERIKTLQAKHDQLVTEKKAAEYYLTQLRTYHCLTPHGTRCLKEKEQFLYTTNEEIEKVFDESNSATDKLAEGCSKFVIVSKN
ncbi:Rho GTPase-activating protein [Acrasis kona]|uniref:Rho GTPase-activating protein n=1 Tax=Acrasis kona TaxID=1008807 RepID=A0AAW2ZJ23_9EUKA